MDEMTKIAIEATERMDEFMFRVMQPYCEDVSEMKISKDDLRDALTLWSRKKEKEPKTISQMLEDIRYDMCEEYCRYTHTEPPEGKDNNWLYENGSPCETCPLNRL